MPGKCTFSDKWLSHVAYKDWVIQDPSSKHKARCRFCQRSFECPNMGEGALKSHMKGAKHKEMASLISEASAPITQFVSTSSSVPSATSGDLASNPSVRVTSAETCRSSAPVKLKETLVSSYMAKEDTLKAEIRWTLYTVERHHSFHSNERIEKVFQDMFSDSAIAMKFSCGEKKSSYISCFGLAPYFAKLLKEKVQKEDSFVLLFDESLNSITKNKQLDVFVRFWDSDKVVSRYWMSQFLGHATSEDLLEHFSKATETLDLRKLFQVSMDGPNVNWKFVDMFSHQLINEYSTTFLNLGSCGLHIVHGAFKHGSDTTGWELDRFFGSIFKLFKDTPARRDDYTRITGSSLFALKFCKHRWVENCPVAERAIEILPNLRKYVKAVQEKKLPDPKTQSFDTVKKMLQDVLLEVKVNFFISIAKEITPFLTLYQTDRVMLPFLGGDLHHMLKSIMSRVIRNSVLKEYGATPQGLMKVDVSDKNNQCTAHKVDLGFVANEQLKKLLATKKVTDKQVLKLRIECKESVITIVKHLWLKSPLGYRIVRALQCLNPQTMANNPERCIEKFQVVLKALVDAKKLKECDVDVTKQQFVSFLDEEIPQHVSELNSFDHNKEDHHIDKLFNEMLASKKCYGQLWDIVKNLLILSHGQATVERGFSTNKQVSIDNLQEQSFVALRQIDDHIKAVKGSWNVTITKQMMSTVASARQRYMAYLDEEKKKKEKQASSLKRKSLVEEVDELKSKKKRLESDAAALVKSADDYSLKAETTRNIGEVRQLVAKSNSHRTTAKGKLEQALEINNEIDMKLQELKDN